MNKKNDLRRRFYGDLRADFQREGGRSFLVDYLRKEGRNKPLHALDAAWQQGLEAYLPLARQILGKNRKLSIDRGLRSALTAWDGGAFPRAKELRGALETALLMEDAKTFLYDSERKRERSLEIFSAYYDSLPAADGAGAVPDEDWETLLDILRKEGRERVFLPIQVDPLSGAGLYIVGRWHLPRSCRREACYYICLCPDDLQEDMGLVLLQRMDEEELEEMCAFPDLSEARAWFTRDTVPSAREFVRGWNQKAPKGRPATPEDCPASLQAFFGSAGERPDRAALAAAGRSAFAEE